MDYTEVQDIHEAYQVNRRLLETLSDAHRSITQARGLISHLQWDYYGMCAMNCGGHRDIGHLESCVVLQWMVHNSIIVLKP